ncbi:MAG: nucleotidyltransferase [Terriglobales bacterium]
MPNRQDEARQVPVSSSTPQQFPEAQTRLFREVLQLMNDRRVPYVVSGAFALQKHTGIFRDTKDLDLFLPAEYADSALRYLNEDGFHTEVRDPVWLAKAHREGYFVDLITGMSNGVITVDMSWIERGSPAEVVGVPSRVLGAEELVASKLFVTRRERFDGADNCHIIYGTCGRLDWQRVLDIVGEHWEIVLWTLMLFAYVYPAHTDYVPRAVWDDLLSRFHCRLHNRNPKAPFRGSLIDEFLFAIDVNEWALEDLVTAYRARRLRKLPGTADEPAA